MNKPNTFIASASLIPVSGNDLPSEIEIMPVGEIKLADDRGLVGRVTDAAALVARSMAAATHGILPIDFGHGMDGEAGADPRAAGWITALRVQGNRIIAAVEWTSAGKEALIGRTFRFISPTFTGPKEGGEVGLILRAGLTNDPALPELAKIASQQENLMMPPWLKQLAAKLGMPDETDEAKIMAAADSALDEVGRIAPIVTAAGLTGALTEEAATAITAKITASAQSGQPDPKAFVPMKAFTEVTTQLASLQKTVDGGQADAVITAAMTEGKLAPALAGWAKEYATKDLEGFKTWLASAPKLVDSAAQTPSGDPAAQSGELTALELEVIQAAGITPEAFLATKQGKSAPATTKGD